MILIQQTWTAWINISQATLKKMTHWISNDIVMTPCVRPKTGTTWHHSIVHMPAYTEVSVPQPQHTTMVQQTKTTTRSSCQTVLISESPRFAPPSTTGTANKISCKKEHSNRSHMPSFDCWCNSTSRILQTFQDGEGLVRSVKIKTKTRVLERPIMEVCWLVDVCSPDKPTNPAVQCTLCPFPCSVDHF